MCTFNIDNYKYDDLEIIMVNDGSTDRSQSIVKELVEKIKDVLINKTIKGLVQRQNRAWLKPMVNTYYL